MRIVKNQIFIILLVIATLCLSVHAQEPPFTGVFDGYEDGRLIVRTSAHSIGHWVVDRATQILSQPQPGDWIQVYVERSGHITQLQVLEHALRRTGVIEAINRDTVWVRSGNGSLTLRLQDWTKSIGIDPSELAAGQRIEVQWYSSSHNVATLSLYPAQAEQMVAPADADSEQGLSAQIPPPALPDYQQPPCPAPDELWTPGYWHWGPAGYYWVPGAWVSPPRVGLLWTPGYWGFAGGAYVFHAGYWGPRVGFYGGINYGGGYYGEGFVGGRWEGGHIQYNTAVVNVNTTVVHNTYVDNTVIRNTTINNVRVNNTGNFRTGDQSRASFSGGPGGTRSTLTANERQAVTQTRFAATTSQRQNQQQAASTPQFRAVSHGESPPYDATLRASQIGSSPMSTQRTNAPSVIAPRAPVNPGVQSATKSPQLSPAGVVARNIQPPVNRVPAAVHPVNTVTPATVPRPTTTPVRAALPVQAVSHNFLPQAHAQLPNARATSPAAPVTRKEPQKGGNGHQ